MTLSDFPTSPRPLPPARNISLWRLTPIIENHEPLVDLEDYGFPVDCVYYRQGIPGSLPRCLARQGVAQRLRVARKLLPESYDLLIWDAYRPLAVQQFLFNRYKAQLRREHPELSEESLVERTQVYISLPSDDPTQPSPHSTGAAIDLTLVHAGVALDMGSPFDHFGPEAATHYFEDASDPDGLLIRDRRRLFYAVLSAAGMKNYPQEWWHWSFGDQMACVSSQKPAVYGRVRAEG